ncbi:hypothetical protein DesyoDRAFT_2030 [Desulfosporosinus youngiae DSM 17734]|uniref:Uncharacterized protein n=1 Tax=Desulfosporosinus youngiae DSM 17734 TaxID=768710 RepID=H5XU35_9FIRM|nr:hypothetical protein DesyoDRAFT_2030 [Desulfosporosinus youngiae DSM 17734]
MQQPIFWDIAGPISLFLLGISFILSIFFFIKKRVKFIILCSIVSLIVAFITLWSIGYYVLILAIVQFGAAVYLSVKIN